MDKIRRYTVKNANGEIIYRCASGHLSDQYIISEIKKRYQYSRQHIKIYKDGKLIERVNSAKQISSKRIKDITTGEIYADIYDMADNLIVSVNEAKKLIKTKLKYKTID